MRTLGLLMYWVRGVRSGAQLCLACDYGGLWQDATSECPRFEQVTDASGSTSRFEGRHGHASVVFPKEGQLALWVVGGRGEKYDKWNLEDSYRFADVWYTLTGKSWTRLDYLAGDFTERVDRAFLREDVMDPGDIAPFWERFGHSLDVVKARNASSEGDGVSAMVLMGGFAPQPQRDVWASLDGESWYMVGLAPWSARGYHATAVFQGALYVLGGSPLSNDVWAGHVSLSGTGGSGDWSMNWTLASAATGDFDKPFNTWSPSDGDKWAPRAGHAVAVQHFGDGERLFLSGGLASWPCNGASECHPLYEEQRARNDVWVTDDGVDWRLLVKNAPWPSRAWHSLTTFVDLTDVRRDVSLAAEGLRPRLWLAGGGYVGTKGNNIVRFVDGYYDLWWTRDGVEWTQVSYSEGAGSDLCSSVEVFKQTDGADYYLGKYGHTMVPFVRTITDATVCRDEEIDEFDADGCVSTLVTNATITVPALFFIAGDAGFKENEALSPSSDVFASNTPILCEIDGHQCPFPRATNVTMSGVEPFSILRTLASTDEGYSSVKVGLCPDPLAQCPDTIQACDKNLRDHPVFYKAPYVHGEVFDDLAYTRYSYTVYVSEDQPHHALSAAGFFTDENGDSLVQGYVARLHGCRCDSGYSGEYCEVKGVSAGKSAATQHAPRRHLAVLTALAVAAFFVPTR